MKIDAFNPYADVEIAGGVHAISPASQREIIKILGEP
jgi:hypothetical protein